MPSPGTCKCSSCKIFFKPNPRSKGRQHFCSRPECRKASKRASQQKWLNKPENRDHFQGSANVQRVQRWRANHPGYWKNVQQSSGTGTPLQETLITQPIEKQEESIVLRRDALQDFIITQVPVLIELIAHLTGSALQDSIARTTQELRELGDQLLYNPHSKKGEYDVPPSLTQSTTTAPNSPTVQLGRSPPGA